MVSRYCWKCGAPNLAHARFCETCGAELPSVKSTSGSENQSAPSERGNKASNQTFGQPFDYTQPPKEPRKESSGEQQLSRFEKITGCKESQLAISGPELFARFAKEYPNLCKGKQYSADSWEKLTHYERKRWDNISEMLWNGSVTLQLFVQSFRGDNIPEADITAKWSQLPMSHKANWCWNATKIIHAVPGVATIAPPSIEIPTSSVAASSTKTTAAAAPATTTATTTKPSPTPVPANAPNQPPPGYAENVASLYDDIAPAPSLSGHARDPPAYAAPEPGNAEPDAKRQKLE
uniref:Zinc-ribbon domain-containing protein n=1 Tax=Eutreptiella gymnastica TaxID=73025 RepID=A0A7S4FTB3_9EUGL